MSGRRKYDFARLCLLALCLAFVGAVWRAASPELFEQFVWGLFLLVAGFGAGNSVEHIAGAMKARRTPEVKA